MSLPTVADMIRKMVASGLVCDSRETMAEVVEGYLENHEHEGLCSEECGCELDDLFPCCELGIDCIPARKVLCGDCENRETDSCIYEWPANADGWCMVPVEEE